MGIFIGALVWLAGARIGGSRKPLQKDIGGLRNHDERYRRHDNHRYP